MLVFLYSSNWFAMISSDIKQLIECWFSSTHALKVLLQLSYDFNLLFICVFISSGHFVESIKTLIVFWILVLFELKKKKNKKIC